ncbi:retinol dehydrogenase 7-like [Tubulanus polymorphus]|uniref:retinol dehydrogenase 7-like n=1 Tax=Tubulanus polymorphus TaxID=672921 RepID=UPI003DA59C5B
MTVTRQLQAAFISCLGIAVVFLLLWCLGHPLLAGSALFVGVLNILYLLHPDTYAKYTVNSKAVIITGCDSGFGHELARKLDRLGFTVFAGCLYPTKSGAHSLMNVGSKRLHVLKLDVTKDEDVTHAVQFIESKLPPTGLWAVVNNAGVTTCSEVEWTSLEEYTRMYDVNFLGLVRVTKAFIPFLRITKGRIINLASLAGRSGIQSFSAYTASKFAVVGFSECLKREMRKFEISVHTIEPGLYRTPISNSDAILASMESNWSQTPKSVQLSYGNRYYHSFRRKLASLLDNEAVHETGEVVDSIVEALLEVHPSTRYVPNSAHRIVAAITPFLPDSFLDSVYAFKFDTKQKVTSKMV